MTNETIITDLYFELLNSWNKRDASLFSGMFVDKGNVVGFDGSQMDGREEIKAELERIFKTHPTGSFVGKIREVRKLSEDVILLRAVAGLILPGDTEIHPEANAIQSLVAVKEGEAWKITLFQNTPAAFHGREELNEALTDELMEVLENPGK
jgi:uncharacterized protein (TIGR02246 family)